VHEFRHHLLPPALVVDVVDKAFCSIYVSCQEPTDITQDWFGVSMMFFVLFIVLIMIVGTAYDYWVYYPTMVMLPKKRVRLQT
jgi:hypothetical protein